jgi:hypothetical protein
MTDRAADVEPDGDGYALVGETTSSDGVFSGKGAKGDWDIFAMRISSAGDVSSAKLIGGAGEDHARSVAPISGGYIVAGETNSLKVYTDSSSYVATDGVGTDIFDGVAAKLDSSLNVSWLDVVGGSGDDNIWSATVLPSSDIVVAGTTGSAGGRDFDGIEKHGSEDAFIKIYKSDGTGYYAPVRLGAAGASTVARAIMARGDDVAICGYTNADGKGKFLGHKSNGQYDAFIMLASLSGDVRRILGN